MNQGSELHGMDGTVIVRWSEPQEREGTAEDVLTTVIQEIDESFPGEIPLTPPGTE